MYIDSPLAISPFRGTLGKVVFMAGVFTDCAEPAWPGVNFDLTGLILMSVATRE
jgi:hypothetical protein